MNEDQQQIDEDMESFMATVLALNTESERLQEMVKDER